MLAAAVAPKVAVVWPATTVAEFETVRVALLFVRLTTALPAGAALVRVTVQMVEALGPKLVGLQLNVDT